MDETPTPMILTEHMERGGADGCDECGKPLGLGASCFTDEYDLVVCSADCYRKRYENWVSSQETVPSWPIGDARG